MDGSLRCSTPHGKFVWSNRWSGGFCLRSVYRSRRKFHRERLLGYRSSALTRWSAARSRVRFKRNSLLPASRLFRSWQAICDRLFKPHWMGPFRERRSQCQGAADGDGCAGRVADGIFRRGCASGENVSVSAIAVRGDAGRQCGECEGDGGKQ